MRKNKCKSGFGKVMFGCAGLFVSQDLYSITSCFLEVRNAISTYREEGSKKFSFGRESIYANSKNNLLKNKCPRKTFWEEEFIEKLNMEKTIKKELKPEIKLYSINKNRKFFNYKQIINKSSNY